MMMPTTLATRSRNESKLKWISFSGRRRRLYMAASSPGSLVRHDRVLGDPDVLQGRQGGVEGTHPVTMDHEAELRAERRRGRVLHGPAAFDQAGDRPRQQDVAAVA